MKKLRLTIVAAAMMAGIMLSGKTIAQTAPCGWDVVETVVDASCFGICDGSISISVVPAPSTVEYLWSTGDMTNQITGLCADEYTVTVTDDKKCAQTHTFTVNEPEELTVLCVTLTNESAPGAADGSIEATANGGDGNYDYHWQTVPAQTGPLATGLSAGTYTVIVYDGKKCEASTSCDITTDEKKDCDGFRTQTQGGWGQCQQNGNNPGSYLFANFAAAFPGGLTIGCNNTLSLSSAQAVCDFLPSGTTPKALPAGAMNDPGASYSNVLAGQLVAAMINVGFDMYDPNFSSNSQFNLGELIITSGTFAGWSVNDLIVEANSKIGGCTSAYGYSALNGALTSINENFVDGITDNGFLTCPEEKKDDRNGIASDASKVSVYPNPAENATQISVYNNADQMLTVELYNVAGQKVATMFSANVKAGSNTQIVFDASDYTPGMYFIKTVAGTEVINNKVVLK